MAKASLLLRLAILLLVVLESLLFAYAMHKSTDGRWILPLDDAYIHQQYAVQAANGHPFQYDNQAPPSSGATSLLYPFVLAAAWRVGLRGDLLSAFAFAFGGACLFLAAVLVARIARRIYAALSLPGSLQPDLVGLLAALLVLANGALLWGFLSGMESGLFVVLLLATLDAFLTGSPRRVALFGGLLALARPEGLVLVGVLAAVAVVQSHWRKADERPLPWLYLLPVALGFVQPALNLALTGSLTANGMRAKSWLYNVPAWPGPIARSIAGTAVQIGATLLTGLVPRDLSGLPGSVLRSPSQVLLYMPPLLAGLSASYLLARAVRDWRERRIGWAALLLAWLIAGLGATATMGTATWHFSRYQLPFFVLALLAGAIAVAHLAVHFGGEKRTRGLFAGLALLVLAASAWSVPGFVWRYGEATQTTLNQQVRLGEWIRADLPADAVVGVHDAGAIAYYGQRPVYDLVGLAAPPTNSLAWRNGAGSTYELMERASHAPDYMAIYNDVWALPYFVGTEVFDSEVFRVEAPDRAGVAAASDRQVVYATDWSLRNSGDRLYQEDMVARTEGLRLVDSLDVADLAEEQAHGYRWWQSLRKPGFPSDAFQLSYWLAPETQVIDGGRLITGGEAFDFKSVPGQDMLLVGRFLGQAPVHLQVKVNGQPLGVWGYGPLPGRWQEQALEIPAAYLTGTSTHVEIAVDASQPGLEFHRPFYYWCYQGTSTEPTPAVERPLNARVGDSMLLLGYSLNAKKSEAGYVIDLDLAWQATQPVAGDYKVFVHWSDRQDNILAQQDTRPGNGLRPTWLWRPDEIITDHYTLILPLEPQPPADTVLYVGMYDAQGGDRLPIARGDVASRLELAELLLP